MRTETTILALLAAIVAAFALRRTFESADIEEFTPMRPNLSAFLTLIRQAEANGDYYALVGGGQFSDARDHPANTGEFAGIQGPSGLTTAAGAYQITRRTWNDLGGVSRYGDFLPKSQDQAAVDLLRRRGAFADIEAGNFDIALTKLKNEWEAFARMLAGNYPITLADAKNIYVNAGGSVT